jgi:hypothetical protein
MTAREKVHLCIERREDMKRSFIFFVAVAATCFSVLTTIPGQAISPPQKSGQFPDIAFPVPTDAGNRKYLGLPESGTFKVSQIKAKAVIIEVFNMY